MTTAEVAEYLGQSPDSTHKWLRRRGIRPTSRATGSAGQNLYRRDDVLSAKPPGRGYRSDLHGPPGEPRRPPETE